MSEYYKSLISDDDVIKELIKDCQRREGKLPIEASRLKPNLNFFERTVHNLVSNNNRIDKCMTTLKSNVNNEKSRALVYKSFPIKKPLVDYAFEKRLVMQTKLKFIKAREVKHKEEKESREIDFTTAKQPRRKRVSNKPDINLKFIGELSTESDNSDAVDPVNFLNDANTKTTCRSNSKVHRIYRSNKRKPGHSEDSDDIIFISSDEETSGKGSGIKIKNKTKRKKSKEHLDRAVKHKRKN